jgi:hypothetical protein
MALSTGIVSKPYISAVNLLDQRDIYKKIIDTQQDDEWLDFMTDADKGVLFTPPKDAAIVPQYHSWYDDELYKIVDTTGASVSGSGTPNISVTGLSSAAQNLVIVGTLLYFPDNVVARVQTVPAADEFTAQSVNGANLTLTPGMKLSAFSNAQEERSQGPTPQRWTVNGLFNYIQLFANSITITDVQNMSGVEFEIDGKQYMLPYEMIRGFQKHRGDISLAFWMGKLSNTLFSDQNPSLVGTGGYGVQTTRGMDSYITTYGITDGVANPGIISLADLSDMEGQLTAQRAPKQYMILGSQPVIATYSDFLKNLPSSGAVNSVRMVVNGREIDMVVDKFLHGGFEFNLKQLNVLSNTSVINYVGTGSSAIDIARSAYFVPMGKTPTYKEGNVDYFRFRYMVPQSGPTGANSTTNGQTVEIMLGALAPIATSSVQELRVQWNSNMGLEVFAPNKFGKQIVI